MNKSIFSVFVILLSMASPASLTAAVTEEYKSVQEINDDQSATPDVELEETIAESPAAPSAPQSAPIAVSQPVAIVSAPPTASLAYASRSPEQGAVLEGSYRPSSASQKSFGITPMVGGAIYSGAWGNNVRNQYGLGLALELPVSPYFAFEIEGGFNNYLLSYTPTVGPMTGQPVINQSFNTYLLGGNGKVYLTRTKLRPFVGAGLMGIVYDNMYGMTPMGPGAYSTIIGSANLLFGLDLAVSETLSFGARASYLIPVINRPFSAAAMTPVGPTAAPGLEDAALINNNLWRIMATMTIRI